MKKYTILLIALIALLAACQPVEGNPVESELYEDQSDATLATQPPATQAVGESTAVSQAEPEGMSEDFALGCTLVSPRPTPGAELVTLFMPTQDDWVRGPGDAKVTILEYSDFQCPYCAGLTPVLHELVEKYPDDIRVVFRHFPLDSVHDKAMLSMRAAEAAGNQGKFWEMHDLLYARFEEWTPMESGEFTIWLAETAVPELDLDLAEFEADLASTELVTQSEKAWQDGQALGLPGTPFVVINNAPYQGPLDFNSLETIVLLTLLEDDQFEACPPMEIDRLSEYYATLETEKGDIILELFPESAPIAVNNFIYLANKGWFDGVTFHRVLPDFIAQAGDPTGTGMGGPGYAFVNEIDEDLVFDRAGLLAMANSGADSNGSQFFITMGPAEHLNGGYTIFGQVVEGMNVVESLTLRNPAESNDLPPGDLIITVTIEER